jgi:hypothetical protein
MMENYVVMEKEKIEQTNKSKKIQINNTTLSRYEYEASQWHYF